MRNRIAEGFQLLVGRLQPGISVLRSEEHTSELQSPYDIVCRLLLEKKKKLNISITHAYNTDILRKHITLNATGLHSLNTCKHYQDQNKYNHQNNTTNNSTQHKSHNL